MPTRELTRGRAFVSASSPALAERIAAAVARSQPNLTVFRDPSAATMGDVATGEGAASYVQAWDAELGKQYDPLVPRPRELEKRFECFITDNASDVDGAYALQARRIPVLLLSSHDGGPTDAESKDGGSKIRTTTVARFAPRGGHPLLTVASDADASVEDAVARFLTFPETPGRVFVVEGGDGAGKQTQVARLVARLTERGYPVRTLDYPHDAARYGLLIREVLGGHRGDLRAVSPLVFAAVYGVNREDHQPILAYWLLKGTNVVLDRYMTANFGHQASKQETDEARFAAIQSLSTFETQWLDLPAPDRVAYLNLPPAFALRAMQEDSTRRVLDAFEMAAVEYKDNVRRAFVWCCDNLPGWRQIECVDKEETVRYSRDQVQEAVWQAFEPEFVNQGQGASLL